MIPIVQFDFDNRIWISKSEVHIHAYGTRSAKNSSVLIEFHILNTLKAALNSIRFRFKLVFIFPELKSAMLSSLPHCFCLGLKVNARSWSHCPNKRCPL